jgi:uncharacterized protein (DUF983 family)
MPSEKPIRMTETMTNDSFADARPPRRPLWPAMLKGAKLKCPKCGEGALFSSYLKVDDSCGTCGQELHHHRADDAPPYFTIFISGHIIIPLMILMERLWAPALWIHMAIWLPVTVIMCLAMLPPVKGSLVVLQWAVRMHGFEADESDRVRTAAD